MRRFLHAAVVMTAFAAAIAVQILGVGSALAAPAPTSLTKASCTAQGGTFARSQGTKTCTVRNPAPDCNNYTNLYVEQPAVTAGQSGYFGTYSANLCYQTTTVQTQKGTGPVTTTSTTTLIHRTVFTYDTCGYFDSSTFTSSYAETYRCYDAGLYPTSF